MNIFRRISNALFCSCKKHYELSEQLGLLLQKKDKKLACAESCSGGGLAKAIAANPESSCWFDRGYVTYTKEAKIELLGVASETIEKYGMVSPETASEMALGALKNSHADLTISITGFAGPDGGTPENPIGTVWFGLAQKNAETKTQRVQFKGNRQDIQASSIAFALKWLIETV